MRRFLSSLLILFTIPSLAEAQGEFAATLLSKIKDFSIYPVFPTANMEYSYARPGYGYEFSFGVGHWTRQMTDDERKKKCNKGARKDPVGCATSTTNTADTTFVLAQTRPTRTGPDSVFNVAIEKDAFKTTYMSFELAVANERNDIERSEIITDGKLTGSVTSWPVLSLYGTFESFFDPKHQIQPFLGARFIISELKDAKVTVGDSAAVSSDKAIGFAGAVGLTSDKWGIPLFAELDYQRLRFEPTWKVPQGFTGPVASLPKRLENSGLRVSVGLQFTLSGQ